MGNSMYTLIFLLLFQLSLLGFIFTSGMIGVALFCVMFGATSPMWGRVVKYWAWAGIATVVFFVIFLMVKALGL